MHNHAYQRVTNEDVTSGESIPLEERESNSPSSPFLSPLGAYHAEVNLSRPKPSVSGTFRLQTGTLARPTQVYHRLGLQTLALLLPHQSRFRAHHGAKGQCHQNSNLPGPYGPWYVE
jgi:hypothetical protein